MLKPIKEMKLSWASFSHANEQLDSNLVQKPSKAEKLVAYDVLLNFEAAARETW